MPKFPLGTYLPKRKIKVPVFHAENEANETMVRLILEEVDKTIEDEMHELAGGVNYVRDLPPIKSQGDIRFTCTAFAVTCINEFSYFQKTSQQFDLSEQFLFFMTKTLEANNDCGSFVRNAVRIITDNGQCKENTWSYNPNGPCVQTTGKPSNADAEASNFKNTFIELAPADIDKYKFHISAKRIIAITIKVYNSWYLNPQRIKRGEITLPVAGEKSLLQGHSVVIVGYQDDTQYPGGGYFILRNSWGAAWGKDNFYGSGYGIVPYDYIKKYCMESFTC